MDRSYTRPPGRIPRAAKMLITVAAASLVAYAAFALFGPAGPMSRPDTFFPQTNGQAAARPAAEPAHAGPSSRGWPSSDRDYAVEREVTRTRDAEPPIATF